MSDPAALVPHTIDAFLGGRIVLVQPEKGHRAGLDAALLQAVIPDAAAGLLVDMGAGVGTIAFSAAARAPALKAIALERDPSLVALARQALLLPENAGFASRVTLLEADATHADDVQAGLKADWGAVDWVLMNPPFDTPGRSRPSPDEGRRAAHMGQEDLLQAWCRTATALLHPGGTLGLIHRAEALPAVLEALSGAFGGVRVLPVHPSKDAPASRIVVSAERAGRAPFSLAPRLVLHEAGGAWTDAADAILRGRATLSL